ncbi:MAG: hypothetical protein ACOX6T_11815 [Myxococcales bacterium]|jgi:tetratricopeptide (TPR) repeat protein
MSRSPRRLALLTALALTFAACAYGKHIDRGDEAFAIGQYDVALAEYEAALKLKPESEEAATKVAQTKEKIVAQACAATRARLAQGDYIGALEVASKALAVRPEAEPTQAAVREVSDRAQEKAMQLADEGNLASALSLLESIAYYLPPESAAVEPKAAGVRARWSARLGKQAASAEQAGRTAEAYLLLGKAAQLSGGTYAQRRDAVRASLLESRRFALQAEKVRSDVERAVLAGVLSSPMPVGLRLLAPDAKSPAPLATLRLALAPPKFAKGTTKRKDRATYQSGVRTVENPFYRQREYRVTEEERRLVGYENEVTRLESDVMRYQAAVQREGPSPNVSTGAEQNLANARSRLESARRRVIDQRAQLQRAREDLRREPQFTEEPVFSELYYTVTIHTLQGSARLQATINHADGRAPLQVAESLSVQVQDEEHAEQPVASVAADPLELPPRDSLVVELQRQAVEKLRGLVLASFDGYRQGLLERAKAAPEAERLDLLALYAFSDASAVDPSVAMELAGRSGIPDALQVLAAAP